MSLRWEWRTFGEHFGAAESHLESVRFDSVVESEETYLLSAQGRDAVKLRGGLMDVKHLLQVDDDGLELWQPVMKSTVPISADDAREVFAALAVHAELTRSSYDLDAIARASPDITAVPVHKTRRRFTLGRCMAELTDVRAVDRSTSTIAIESEQPADVIAAVRALGLDPHPNVNVPRGLKDLVRL
jgi:exopolyphosphatase/guanosine-5'-triphosphate,3'-diphosphate pyrophosphatase